MDDMYDHDATIWRSIAVVNLTGSESLRIDIVVWAHIAQAHSLSTLLSAANMECNAVVNAGNSSL